MGYMDPNHGFWLSHCLSTMTTGSNMVTKRLSLACWAESTKEAFASVPFIRSDSLPSTPGLFDNCLSQSQKLLSVTVDCSSGNTRQKRVTTIRLDANLVAPGSANFDCLSPYLVFRIFDAKLRALMNLTAFLHLLRIPSTYGSLQHSLMRRSRPCALHPMCIMFGKVKLTIRMAVTFTCIRVTIYIIILLLLICCTCYINTRHSSDNSLTSLQFKSGLNCIG